MPVSGGAGKIGGYLNARRQDKAALPPKCETVHRVDVESTLESIIRRYFGQNPVELLLGFNVNRLVFFIPVVKRYAGCDEVASGYLHV